MLISSLLPSLTCISIPILIVSGMVLNIGQKELFDHSTACKLLTEFKMSFYFT